MSDDSTQMAKKRKSPWRAWNPGWLKRDADRLRAERVVPVHGRLVRGAK